MVLVCFFWQDVHLTVLSFLQDRVINLVVGGLTSLLLVVSIPHPVFCASARYWGENQSSFLKQADPTGCSLGPGSPFRAHLSFETLGQQEENTFL